MGAQHEKGAPFILLVSLPKLEGSKIENGTVLTQGP